MSRVIVATLAAVLVLATSGAQAVGWGNQVTITNIQANTNGYFYVNTSGNQNLDSCTANNWLVVSDTTYKFVVATLLSAQATGQTVSLYYNGCINGYPNITVVAVPNL